MTSALQYKTFSLKTPNGSTVAMATVETLDSNEEIANNKGVMGKLGSSKAVMTITYVYPGVKTSKKLERGQRVVWNRKQMVPMIDTTCRR